MMTETPTHNEAHSENPFTPEDIVQFDAADAEAGGAIGKMLTLFFFYTVVVMMISGLWTYFAIN